MHNLVSLGKVEYNLINPLAERFHGKSLDSSLLYGLGLEETEGKKKNRGCLRAVVNETP